MSDIGPESQYAHDQDAIQRLSAARAEAEALLREARDVIARMTDGPHRADWGDMLDKIDVYLAGGGK